MPCNSDYHRLLHRVELVILSDAFGRLVPIHVRHITIHQDQIVVAHLVPV
jgi:hypothetical protein